MAESSLHLRRLEGKVAIITGAASGIGEATARLFSSHGARVVIADIQDEKGQKVAESIGSNSCSYIHCDVADEKQVQAMIEWTLKTHGRLDIMFANAGIVSMSDHQTVLDLDFSQLHRLFAINVDGVAACVKHAARGMIAQGIKGSIVCTASTFGSIGGPTRTDYHMSKHAVLGLMRCASKQLGQYGIRVNSVSPTAVVTPMVCNSYKMTVEEAEECFQLSSLKGMSIKANNVADAVLFLASDDSSRITGHDLHVDGGSRYDTFSAITGVN